ncbi:hypothetical protein H310_08268 [Aphanomyces invadans]|uniref:RING-type domain-containing protein n=1 Tax=Aphanomyces invadans TaxID=157072 RepID=A0A024U1X3_9STRA|nr:hypothetical protein H310_08268 [Aphanomyces invadans]ETV99617.1 hypothetical protein H310_08268 [Aphanomyces invadans]|eukprot:XP_008872173.1 hypothetical protein H310_08268 [Aphanomyces invadans]
MGLAPGSIVAVGVVLALMHMLQPRTLLAVLGSAILVAALLAVAVMVWIAWVFTTLKAMFSRPSKAAASEPTTKSINSPNARPGSTNPPNTPPKATPNYSGLVTVTIGVLACIGGLMQGIQAIHDLANHNARRRTNQPPRLSPPCSTPSAPPPVQCVVCLDAVETAGCATCDQCSIQCCGPCIEKYFRIKILQDRQAHLPCPSCGAALSAGILTRFLSPYLAGKLHELEQTERSFKCPKCQCRECFGSKYSNNRRLTCTECRSAWCIDCGQTYHYFATKGCSDRSFRQWRAKHHIKPCPNCKRFIEKNEGCNHMTCTQCKKEVVELHESDDFETNYLFCAPLGYETSFGCIDVGLVIVHQQQEPFTVLHHALCHPKVHWNKVSQTATDTPFTST